MQSNFVLPPSGFGPGSQPLEEEDKELDFLPLPSGMRTFDLQLPEVEDPAAIAPALALLRGVAAACRRVAAGGAPEQIDLSELNGENRQLIAETMGSGEVSLRIHTGSKGERIAQESVFAGVWQIAGPDLEILEVASIPSDAMTHAHSALRAAQLEKTPANPQVVNAPPLLAELVDKAGEHTLDAAPYVVNLSLLPHTPQDLEWLETALGEGGVKVLSRGYGNCRVTATALAPVWHVQFFNSMDTLILDTYEVTAMPEVVVAATEDLEDSAERLLEVVEAIR